MQPSDEFMLKEFDAARARIESEIAAINQNEIVYVTLFFAIYAAVLQFQIADKKVILAFAILNFILAIYGLIRYTAHRQVIKLHESYIKYVIEFHFYNQPQTPDIDRTFGLIAYYDKNKGYPSRVDKRGVMERSGYLKFTRYGIWITLIVLSLVVIHVASDDPNRIRNLYKGTEGP